MDHETVAMAVRVHGDGRGPGLGPRLVEETVEFTRRIESQEHLSSSLTQRRQCGWQHRTPHNVAYVMLTVKASLGMLGCVDEAVPVDEAALEAVVAAWLSEYESPSTRAAYRTDLDHFERWSRSARANPLALESSDLERYRAECESDGAGPATIARRLSAIASFGNFAHERGAALAAPRIERPRLPRSSTTESLDADDATALLAAA